MKLLLHILAFVLLSGVAAFAQGDSVFTISGRVTRFTGEPLQYSAIKLIGTTRGAFLDSLGNFFIKNVKTGNYNLTVKYFGCSDFDTSLVVLKHNIENFNIYLPAPVCNEISRQFAIEAIKADTIRLLLTGGIAPEAIDDDDLSFEKRYNITYYQYGCVSPCIECVAEYNYVVFKYLDQKFGKSWRESVRPDIIGFKEYITEN